MEQSLYLMLDSKGTPIARGRVQGGTGGQYWQIQVEDGKIDEILAHKKLKLLSVMDTGPSYEGVIVRSRNDMIQLEVTKINADAHDMRKNLRVVVEFHSFAYPLSGSWTGRREVVSNDLSAGGIAFFTDHSLQVGEQVEVVVPVTAQPLVLRCQVLGIRPSGRPSCVLQAPIFLYWSNPASTWWGGGFSNLPRGGGPGAPGPGA